MPYAHTEIAYWSVVKDLIAPEDIPIALLKAALPEFLASSGSASKAGAVIISHLNGIAWDWPAWHAFAKKTDRYTLTEITTSVAKIRPIDLLVTLAVPELKRRCKDREIIPEKKATKDQIVVALLKATKDGSEEKLFDRIRRQILEKESHQCRKQMALHMAARITKVAYTMERYEQLKSFPFWRFVWGGGADIDAPKECRKFNNEKLSATEAKHNFPVLPCDYLQCGCYIVGDSRIK
jgi:hypothetical protein